MNNEKTKIRSIVRREHADGYLLTSLVVFGATVIFTRLFLQLTGFPQIGNSVLHIAHALWGGLLLFVAVVITLGNGQPLGSPIKCHSERTRHRTVH